MSKEIFLIDSNILIRPHAEYYPFDFAPGFWTQMENCIKNGSIKILDMVENEILRGNETDDLKVWMEGLGAESIDHRRHEILEKYAEIIQYLGDCNLYKPSALTEWSRESVADPWLIATAAAYDYTLITFEAPSGWRQWSGKHHCLRFFGTKMPPKRHMEAFRGWAISW